MPEAPALVLFAISQFPTSQKLGTWGTPLPAGTFWVWGVHISSTLGFIAFLGQLIPAGSAGIWPAPSAKAGSGARYAGVPPSLRGKRHPRPSQRA